MMEEIQRIGVVFMSIRQTSTPFLSFDMARCRACFACVEACPRQVLGQVRLPFHKHVHIDRPDACIGCGRCLTVCPAGVIQRREVG